VVLASGSLLSLSAPQQALAASARRVFRVTLRVLPPLPRPRPAALRAVLARASAKTEATRMPAAVGPEAPSTASFPGQGKGKAAMKRK
jgi:hypothetical protein